MDDFRIIMIPLKVAKGELEFSHNNVNTYMGQLGSILDIKCFGPSITVPINAGLKKEAEMKRWAFLATNSNQVFDIFQLIFVD